MSIPSSLRNPLGALPPVSIPNSLATWSPIVSTPVWPPDIILVTEVVFFLTPLVELLRISAKALAWLTVVL